jgi:hypothetical protein
MASAYEPDTVTKAHGRLPGDNCPKPYKTHAARLNYISSMNYRVMLDISYTVNNILSWEVYYKSILDVGPSKITNDILRAGNATVFFRVAKWNLQQFL